MLRLLLTNKGITIIEALVATFLTAVAVISLMPMQDSSIRTSFRADYLGKAAGIMQAELEMRENQIMRGTVLASPINQVIHVSGLPGVVEGDATFNVTTTTVVKSVADEIYIVNVRVTWTQIGMVGAPTSTINSSIITTPQKYF